MSEDIRISDKPLSAALFKDDLIVATRCKVFKTSKGDEMREETILEMNQDEEIKSTNFFNDQLFLSINNNKSKNWSITCIHLNNNSATEIFACKSEIKWMLAARGRNLNESFYVENKMSLDVGDEDCLLIVWNESNPCLLFNDQKFPILRRSLCSKMSFILQYVVLYKEKESLNSFADLLNNINTEKKMNGYLSEQEIIQIEICDLFFVILLACGSLILFDETGKYSISKQISWFSIANCCLTALRNDSKILICCISDLKESSKSSTEAAFNSVSDLSRKVSHVDEMLAVEQTKLDHIRIFSSIQEDKIFEVEANIKQDFNFPFDPVYKLSVIIKLTDTQIQIKQEFFIFKLVLQTSFDTIERTVPVPNMRQEDALHTSIPMENLNTQSFPLQLNLFLVLKESSMIENSLGFIYSEKLYSKELSPLEFLSLDVVSRNIDGNRQLLSGNDGLERDRFLALLDNDVREEKIVTSTVSISTQTTDKYPILNQLTAPDVKRVTYSLFQKKIEFAIVNEDENMDENSNTRTWVLSGSVDTVTLLTKHLK